MKVLIASVQGLSIALPAIACAEECAAMNGRQFEPAVALHEVEDGPTTYFSEASERAPGRFLPMTSCRDGSIVMAAS